MTPPPTRRRRPALEPAPSPRELRAHPVMRNYTLLCLAALLLLVVCLVDRGMGWWCLIPALLGSVAFLASWSLGPPLVLLSVMALVLSDTRYRWGYAYSMRDQVPTVMDLLLCAAVLAYVLGHYRLLALLRHIFPTDPRQSRKDAAQPAQRRSADLVDGWELARVALALPVWTGVSVMAWGWMIEDAPALEMSIEVWRTLRVVWVVLAVLGTTAIVAGYLRQTLATPEEGLLYLQDQLWRATRREQSIVNRWLAWARLRARQGRDTQ
jgi:hypothetical protein